MKPVFKSVLKRLMTPVVGALLALTLWLLWVSFDVIQWQNENLFAHSYSVWGDWSAHFTFISMIQERGIQSIFQDNPIFAGVPFQYPFFSHVLTALFSQITGLGVIQSTYLLSLFLLALLPLTLFRFYRSIGLSAWSALTSCLLFLLAGGYQFLDPTLDPQQPLTNQFQHGSIFTQITAFELIPQRALLFGLILFLTSVTLLIRSKRLTRPCCSLVCFPLLVFTHIHSWIAMAVSLLIAWIAGNSVASRKNTLQFGIAVAAISGIFFWILLFRNGMDSGPNMNWSWWSPGWAQSTGSGQKAAQEMNFFSFWWLNTGLFLPLAFIGTYLSEKKSLLQLTGIIGITLFILPLLFQFQPYFYDNLKIFTYGWLFLSPLVALSLSRFIKVRALAPLALLLLAFQCYSGYSDLMFIKNQNQRTLFFSNTELELVQTFQSIRKSADDRVLIVPRHNHWVSCLSGNPIVMGYAGWLWTWGIDYREREQQAKQVLLGQDTSGQTLQKLGAKYLIVHENDQIDGKRLALASFDARYSLIHQAHGWRIYSLE